MTKIDIVSGFLGAGKTTLIKKLLEEAFVGEKVALIENEFGEIGIDGAILKNYDIQIKELNSGCICCTIAGNFSLALKEVLKSYQPDRIIIEPSGVGKLSDVINGCSQFLKKGEITLNICMVVVDGLKYKMYIKNFSEFYQDQLIHAKTIILSRTQRMNPELVEYVQNSIQTYNPQAMIITTDWMQMTGRQIVDLSEKAEETKLENKLLEELQHHHHHADEVFSVWGKETAKIFHFEKLKDAVDHMNHTKGFILRAKGIVRTEPDRWVQFDYVPGESSFKETVPDYTGRICVIGNDINEQELSEIFGLS
jgi:G3E family GTPase